MRRGKDKKERQAWWDADCESEGLRVKQCKYTRDKKYCEHAGYSERWDDQLPSACRLIL